MVEFNALLDRHAMAQEREDSRAALICTILANINRGKRRPFKLEDFMLVKPKYRGHSKPAQSSKSMLAIVEMMNMAFKGEDKRKK